MTAEERRRALRGFARGPLGEVGVLAPLRLEGRGYAVFLSSRPRPEFWAFIRHAVPLFLALEERGLLLEPERVFPEEEVRELLWSERELTETLAQGLGLEGGEGGPSPEEVFRAFVDQGRRQGLLVKERDGHRYGPLVAFLLDLAQNPPPIPLPSPLGEALLALLEGEALPEEAFTPEERFSLEANLRLFGARLWAFQGHLIAVEPSPEKEKALLEKALTLDPEDPGLGFKEALALYLLERRLSQGEAYIAEEGDADRDRGGDPLFGSGEA